jgi:hypothetical protein
MPQKYKCDPSNQSVFCSQILWFQYYFNLVQYFANFCGSRVSRNSEIANHKKASKVQVQPIKSECFLLSNLMVSKLFQFSPIFCRLQLRGVREIRKFYIFFKGTCVTYQFMLFFTSKSCSDITFLINIFSDSSRFARNHTLNLM